MGYNKTMKFKVVFLDIDGVLNNFLSHKEKDSTGHFPYDVKINHEKVALLNKLLSTTKAKIVLSTRWVSRIGLQETITILASHGITGPYVMPNDVGEEDVVKPMDWLDSDAKGKFYGVLATPKKMSSEKCHEIGFWLYDYSKYVESYVILDDDLIYSSSKEDRASRQVQTNPEKGLTEEDIKKAINILNIKLIE